MMGTGKTRTIINAIIKNINIPNIIIISTRNSYSSSIDNKIKEVENIMAKISGENLSKHIYDT